MKFSNFKKIFFIFIFATALVFPTITKAQTEPEDPCPIPFDPCPIDDGILLLIGAAVVIAAKKTFYYKKTVQIL